LKIFPTYDKTPTDNALKIHPLLSYHPLGKGISTIMEKMLDSNSNQTYVVRIMVYSMDLKRRVG